MSCRNLVSLPIAFTVRFSKHHKKSSISYPKSFSPKHGPVFSKIHLPSITFSFLRPLVIFKMVKQMKNFYSTEKHCLRQVHWLPDSRTWGLRLRGQAVKYTPNDFKLSVAVSFKKELIAGFLKSAFKIRCEKPK